MKELFLLFVFVLTLTTRATLLDLDITSTIQFTKKFSDLSIYRKHVEVLKYFILNISEIEHNLAIHYILNINEEVQEVFTKTSLIHSSSQAIVDDEPYEHNYDSLIVSIADYFAIIQNLFNTFIDRLKVSNRSIALCSLPWANGIPQGTNLVDSLTSIKQLTSGINFISLFTNILNTYSDNCMISRNIYCDKNVTMPDKLISIYHYITAVERKRFIMESFVQLIKSACNNDTDTHSIVISREVLTIKTQRYLEILKQAILHSERGIYRCSQEEGSQTDLLYIELEGFKRTVVLNKRLHSAENTCILSCSNINDEKLSISYADYSARRDYCPGRLIDCESSGDVELCHAMSGDSRLYKWIKTNLTGKIYGELSECSESIEIMRRYQYEPNSFFYCEPCICTCVQDTIYTIPRYGISLKEEIADIERNEAITGIKFIEKNKIIYPQIETGRLLSDGHIQKSSNKWKSLNLIDSIDKTLDISSEKFQQERVYFGSSSEDIQFINLEQINLTDEYVITGVKFIVVKKKSLYTNAIENFISIAIQATHYNIKSGKLGKYPTDWIIFNPKENEDKCDTYQFRKELRFPESDSPLKYRTLDINSVIGDYVGFWSSSLKKDAGQTTIPFFDAAPVFGVPRFPLGGLGLYHKGSINSAGFIAFKIAGIDYTAIINTAISDEDKIDFDAVLSPMHMN